MNPKLFAHSFGLGLLLSFTSLCAQSPGGVARQSVWLKGNFLPDSTPASYLNFNPATLMVNRNTQVILPGNIDDLRRSTIFTVFQGPKLNLDQLVWKITGDNGDLSLSTSQVSSQSEKMNLVFAQNLSASAKSAIPKTIISTYLRRVSQNPESAESNNIALQFSEPGSSLNHDQSSGSVAEFIVYQTLLKDKDIAKIETYLALKYGVTLEKNYLNSQGETIWNRKNEHAFSNNIAGIGRDDQSTLNQKQGTSSGSTDGLMIGINAIAATNQDNPGQINDGDFLIWGDNAKPFLIDQNNRPVAGDVWLPDKKWLMKTVGSTAKTIATELKINTKTILTDKSPKGVFYLVMDRSGTGNFDLKNCSYFLPDSISPDGVASFKNLLWDTDGSGKDIFTFGVNPGLTVNVEDIGLRITSFQVYPNPVTTGHYKVAISLNKPSEINFQIYDGHLRLIDSRKMSGQADYFFSGEINSPAGVYIVKILVSGREFSKILILQ